LSLLCLHYARLHHCVAAMSATAGLTSPSVELVQVLHAVLKQTRTTFCYNSCRDDRLRASCGSDNQHQQVGSRICNLRKCHECGLVSAVHMPGWPKLVTNVIRRAWVSMWLLSSCCASHVARSQSLWHSCAVRNSTQNLCCPLLLPAVLWSRLFRLRRPLL
jgi:hypothetical protein